MQQTAKLKRRQSYPSWRYMFPKHNLQVQEKVILNTRKTRQSLSATNPIVIQPNVYLLLENIMHSPVYQADKRTDQCYSSSFSALRPRQNGRHFANDAFRRIFLNESVRISIDISLKFGPKGPIDNIPALVQIMAWFQQGDKPLSEPMMVTLSTHICITRSQWVSFGMPNFEMQYAVPDLYQTIYVYHIYQWEDHKCKCFLAIV